MTTGMGSDLAGIVERDARAGRLADPPPFYHRNAADRRALLGLLRETREALKRLADEAARAVTEPRRFHEDEDGRQHELSSRVAIARALLRAALDPATTEPKEPE